MINVQSAMPVLPAASVTESLAWWVNVCGFVETFRDGPTPHYAGIQRDGARLHLAAVSDARLARQVGDQTMVRVTIEDLDAFYAEFKSRAGVVHPNGDLSEKPWGSREFSAIDPNGVCVAFVEA